MPTLQLQAVIYSNLCAAHPTPGRQMFEFEGRTHMSTQVVSRTVSGGSECGAGRFLATRDHAGPANRPVQLCSAGGTHPVQRLIPPRRANAFLTARDCLREGGRRSLCKSPGARVGIAGARRGLEHPVWISSPDRAWLLVLFLVPVTLAMHNFWAVHDPMMAQIQMAMFMKNVSILGGALLISQFGSGPLSLDSRRK